jgi:hypothetical protein
MPDGATLAPTTGSKAAPPQKARAPRCISAARRRPELFVAGECLAQGPRQTLQTMLHEAVHALAHARGVKDTSRDGKYHNKRENVALAGELGLAWPQGQRPHPVIGFSEVQLTQQALADYADTLAYLGRPSACTATPSAGWGCSSAKAGSRAARSAAATSKAGERFKVACGCQPPRSFWTAPSSTCSGRLPTGSAARTSNPRTPATKTTLDNHAGIRFKKGGGLHDRSAWRVGMSYQAATERRTFNGTAGEAFGGGQ